MEAIKIVFEYLNLNIAENSLGKEGLLNLISGELKDETKIELSNKSNN
jgi:hypothetical protein